MKNDESSLLRSTFKEEIRGGGHDRHRGLVLYNRGPIYNATYAIICSPNVLTEIGTCDKHAYNNLFLLD